MKKGVQEPDSDKVSDSDDDPFDALDAVKAPVPESEDDAFDALDAVKAPVPDPQSFKSAAESEDDAFDGVGELAKKHQEKSLKSIASLLLQKKKEQLEVASLAHTVDLKPSVGPLPVEQLMSTPNEQHVEALQLLERARSELEQQARGFAIEVAEHRAAMQQQRQEMLQFYVTLKTTLLSEFRFLKHVPRRLRLLLVQAQCLLVSEQGRRRHQHSQGGVLLKPATHSTTAESVSDIVVLGEWSNSPPMYHDYVADCSAILQDLRQHMAQAMDTAQDLLTTRVKKHNRDGSLRHILDWYLIMVVFIVAVLLVLFGLRFVFFGVHQWILSYEHLKDSLDTYPVEM